MLSPHERLVVALVLIEYDFAVARFAPDPARLPEVSVQLAPLSSYDVLMEAVLEVAP